MEISISTGPRFPMYEAPNLNDMESRLKREPELLARRKFLLVLGEDGFRGSDLTTVVSSLSVFAERNGMVLGDIVTIYGRSGIDKVLLVHMTRR